MIVAGACRLCSETALDVALRNGHTETAKALVAMGASTADVHGKDWQEYSQPLHRWRSTLHLSWGVRCGHMLLCRRTALHLASEKGLVELVKALVESGADVHAKDNQGYGRPLHLWRRALAVDADGAMRAHVGCAGGRRCTLPQRRVLWSW